MKARFKLGMLKGVALCLLLGYIAYDMVSSGDFEKVDERAASTEQKQSDIKISPKDNSLYLLKSKKTPFNDLSQFMIVFAAAKEGQPLPGTRVPVLPNMAIQVPNIPQLPGYDLNPVGGEKGIALRGVIQNADGAIAAILDTGKDHVIAEAGTTILNNMFTVTSICVDYVILTAADGNTTKTLYMPRGE